MSIAPPSVPYVPAWDHGGAQSPKAVVLHGTVTSDNRGTARNVVRSWNQSDVKSSAHYVIDAGEVIQAVGDHTVAYHCGYNQDTIGIEHCDEQTGPASRWDDADSKAILAKSAKLTARLCAAYGIAPKRPTIDELKRKGPHGIYSHDDSRRAFGRTAHTDPRDFPWTSYMAAVRKEYDLLLNPPPPPEPITTHTRWAIRETGVHVVPGGERIRNIPAGYKFQVVDGSGSGMNGWVQTSAGNWVLGADTTTRDPAMPSRLSVLSWNVKAGAARVDTVLAELRAMTAEHKPDVIALQECYNLPRFGDAFPGYAFSYQAAGEAKTEGYVSEYPANVMLVRDGVEVKVQAPLEMTESWKGPKVGAMHDPRIHRRVTVLKDGVIWRVVDMHVPPPVSGGGNNDAIAESNAAMVECLTEFAADEPVIIVGDMNQDNATVVRRVGAPGGAVVDGGGVDLAVFRDCTKTRGENLGLHTSDHPAKRWDFEA